MTENIYFVYLHTFNNGKLYIGKGKDSRATDFRQRSTYWRRMYSKYGEPTVSYVDEHLDEATAFELEEFCIEEAIDKGYKLGDTLINFTSGGEGASGYKHDDETKAVISKASKEKWQSEEYREDVIRKLKAYLASEDGKKERSRNTKKKWEDPDYRKTRVAQLNDMWKDETHIKKMRDRMRGSGNPAARKANIYKYPSGELIAENIVSAEWARDNGYSRSKLQVTSRADRSKPSTADNPHHHKKVYMEYVDGK